MVAVRTSAADGGFADVGRSRPNRNERPIEIIMACEAGRISIGDSRPDFDRRR
jgi:hypothetical protein